MNDVEDNVANVEVNETSYKIELDTPVKVAPRPVTYSAIVPETESGAPAVTKQPTTPKRDDVKSLLSGTILDIKVKTRDAVRKGQTIVILGTMKVENNINIGKDGKVAEIEANKGDSILEGTDLIIIE